jgi:hypothetical protein
METILVVEDDREVQYSRERSCAGSVITYWKPATRPKPEAIEQQHSGRYN